MGQVQPFIESRNYTITIDGNIIEFSDVLAAQSQEESTEFAEQLYVDTKEALKQIPHGEAMLLVALPVGEAVVSPGAAKIIRNMLKENVTKRTAIHGDSKQHRMMTNALVTLSGSGEKIRSFDTRDEALAWLRE